MWKRVIKYWNVLYPSMQCVQNTLSNMDYFESLTCQMWMSLYYTKTSCFEESGLTTKPSCWCKHYSTEMKKRICFMKLFIIVELVGQQGQKFSWWNIALAKSHTDCHFLGWEVQHFQFTFSYYKCYNILFTCQVWIYICWSVLPLLGFLQSFSPSTSK